MANPQKGEVAFEAGGKAYVFKLDFNALCSLEQLVKMPFPKFLKRKEDEWGAIDLRSVFCCGLDDYQLSAKDVGKIIQQIGQAKAGEIIAEAIASGLTEDAKSNANPPQAIPLRGIGNG